MASRRVYNKVYTPEIWEKVNPQNKELLDDFLMDLRENKRSPITISQYYSDLRGFFCYLNTAATPLSIGVQVTLTYQPDGTEGVDTFTSSAAAAAYTNVLANAGAFPRDTTDARIIADVTNRTGGLVDEPPA